MTGPLIYLFSVFGGLMLILAVGEWLLERAWTVDQ